jgi:hypothetical protein
MLPNMDRLPEFVLALGNDVGFLLLSCHRKYNLQADTVCSNFSFGVSCRYGS